MDELNLDIVKGFVVDLVLDFEISIVELVPNLETGGLEPREEPRLLGGGSSHRVVVSNGLLQLYGCW